MINPNDNRLKVAEASKPKEFKRGKDDPTKDKVNPKDKKVTKLNQIAIREVEQGRTALFFEHNT